MGKISGVSAADPCHWIPSVWGAGGGCGGASERRFKGAGSGWAVAPGRPAEGIFCKDWFGVSMAQRARFPGCKLLILNVFCGVPGAQNFVCVCVFGTSSVRNLEF